MWGAIASGLAKVGMDIASAAYNNHEARRNNAVASKVAWEYYQKQKELDYRYDANQYLNLDKSYFTWQNNQAYKLAQQYAQNSAHWTVDGLRRAGINPLLAVSSGLGGASTFGDVQTNSAPRTGNAHFSPGHIDTARVDAANAAFSGAKSALDMRQTAAVTSNTIANTTNTQTDTVLKEAQAQKALIDAANSARNGGYTSFASQLLNSAKDLISSDSPVVQRLQNSARGIGHWLGLKKQALDRSVDDANLRMRTTVFNDGKHYLDDPDIPVGKKLQTLRHQLKKQYPDMDSRTRASVIRKESRRLRSQSRK